MRFKLVQQIQNLRLNGDVQGRGRLIGNEQFGFARQGHGNHHPLTHATRELMGIVIDPLCGLGNIDQPQHVTGLGHGLLRCQAFVQPECLGNLLTHTQNRVERRHGLLKNHGNFFSPQIAHSLRICLHQVCALEPYLAVGDASGRHGQEFHDGHGGDTFTAARLTHDTQCFASIDVKINAIDRMQHTVIGVKVNLKVLNFQQGV